MQCAPLASSTHTQNAGFGVMDYGRDGSCDVPGPKGMKTPKTTLISLLFRE